MSKLRVYIFSITLMITAVVNANPLTCKTVQHCKSRITQDQAKLRELYQEIFSPAKNSDGSIVLLNRQEAIEYCDGISNTADNGVVRRLPTIKEFGEIFAALGERSRNGAIQYWTSNIEGGRLGRGFLQNDADETIQGLVSHDFKAAVICF